MVEVSFSAWRWRREGKSYKQLMREVLPHWPRQGAEKRAFQVASHPALSFRDRTCMIGGSLEGIWPCRLQVYR